MSPDGEAWFPPIGMLYETHRFKILAFEDIPERMLAMCALGLNISAVILSQSRSPCPGPLVSSLTPRRSNHVTYLNQIFYVCIGCP
jgi:hypothetical protein